MLVSLSPSAAGFDQLVTLSVAAAYGDLQLATS